MVELYGITEMIEFNQFLLNNYYGCLTFDQYADMLEEYFDNNPEVADDFGCAIGEALAQDVIDAAELREDELGKLALIDDHIQSAYEYALARSHYEYLIDWFRNVITSSDKQVEER